MSVTEFIHFIIKLEAIDLFIVFLCYLFMFMGPVVFHCGLGTHFFVKHLSCAYWPLMLLKAYQILSLAKNFAPAMVCPKHMFSILGRPSELSSRGGTETDNNLMAGTCPPYPGTYHFTRMTSLLSSNTTSKSSVLQIKKTMEHFFFQNSAATLNNVLETT